MVSLCRNSHVENVIGISYAPAASLQEKTVSVRSTSLLSSFDPKMSDSRSESSSDSSVIVISSPTVARRAPRAVKTLTVPRLKNSKDSVSRYSASIIPPSVKKSAILPLKTVTHVKRLDGSSKRLIRAKEPLERQQSSSSVATSVSVDDRNDPSYEPSSGELATAEIKAYVPLARRSYLSLTKNLKSKEIIVRHDSSKMGTSIIASSPLHNRSSNKETGSKPKSAWKAKSPSRVQYIVESIVGKSVNKGNEIYYKLRWQGYGPSDDTWVNKKDCACDMIIEEYEKGQKDVEPKKKAPTAKLANHGKEVNPF